MVKIYAASQTPRIYGSGAGTLDTTPFLLFDETLPAIASPTTLGYGEHVELTSPVTVGLPTPRKGAKLVIRNMSGGYSSVAAGSILHKGDTYTSLDFDTNTVALLKVIDGVWTASLVTEGGPFSPIVATGGTVTEFTNPETGITYRVHSFTSVGSSTFTVSNLGSTSGEVEYLVVAGGGGGAISSSTSSSRSGGGGGAGGYRCSVAGEMSGGGQPAESPLILSEGNHNVVVGGGGLYSTNRESPALSGENSNFAGIIALGGGRGSHHPPGFDPSGNEAETGGSGGAGGRGSGEGADGAAGQGYAGGDGGHRTGGGGGGAGGIGGNGGGDNVGANGGLSVASSITGSLISRAGGGANAWGVAEGGGGTGAGSSANGNDGLPNTGGGGSGSSDNHNGRSGSGGSGIIIVRYIVRYAIAYP